MQGSWIDAVIRQFVRFAQNTITSLDTRRVPCHMFPIQQRIDFVGRNINFYRSFIWFWSIVLEAKKDNCIYEGEIINLGYYEYITKEHVIYVNAMAEWRNIVYNMLHTNSGWSKELPYLEKWNIEGVYMFLLI
jgi:hypothetical protein